MLHSSTFRYLLFAHEALDGVLGLASLQQLELALPALGRLLVEDFALDTHRLFHFRLALLVDRLEAASDQLVEPLFRLQHWIRSIVVDLWLGQVLRIFVAS